MGRLCERPGCSEPASVAYGMRPEDLIFWLDHLIEGSNINEEGALCRRHADSMVVPRSWTLDDLRDPELHLFRPPTGKRRSGRRGRRPAAPDDGTEQLELGVDVQPDTDPADGATPPDADTRTDDSRDADATGDATGAATGATTSGAAGAGQGVDDTDDAGDAIAPWTPSFDSSDDLGGLLAARSPLLARAFRGDDRPAR